jgi:demethylmenaquinone methyltransferase / 2-methoxy-6-polyprenyl-1,4-benzoquinol methylase
LSQEGDSCKSRTVQEMFSAIAGRYDFLNHLLSLNIDRYWRRICLREVEKRLQVSTVRILDLGCGTADLALELASLGPVFGCDFSHPMLRIGAEKVARMQRAHPIYMLEGDAMALPFAERTFDAVVSAFVLRNLPDIRQGLTEMKRVLKPGGVLGVLDFGVPRAPILGGLYLFYFTRILPFLGRIISGVDGAYRYLPDSVRTFPPAEELETILSGVGFSGVQFRLLTFGVAVLLLARAPE